MIRTESRHEGDPTQQIALERDGVWVGFVNAHRGKNSRTLGLRSSCDYPERGHSEEILARLDHAEREIAAMRNRGVI